MVFEPEKANRQKGMPEKRDREYHGRKEGIKIEWSGFDQETSMILESTMQRNIERKIETLTNMVCNIGKQRSGTKKGKSGNEQKEHTPNMRERRIRGCRQELNKQLKRAKYWEKAEIAQLTNDIRSLELSRLHRAEQLRRKRERKTGEDLLKTLSSSQRSFSVKTYQGQFTVERMKLRGIYMKRTPTH